MLEVTVVFLIAVVVFYILSIVFKIQELNFMALIVAVCALACVLKDNAIMNTDYVALFVVPLFYVILMTIVKVIVRDD